MAWPARGGKSDVNQGLKVSFETFLSCSAKQQGSRFRTTTLNFSALLTGLQTLLMPAAPPWALQIPPWLQLKARSSYQFDVFPQKPKLSLSCVVFSPLFLLFSQVVSGPSDSRGPSDAMRLPLPVHTSMLTASCGGVLMAQVGLGCVGLIPTSSSSAAT